MAQFIDEVIIKDEFKNLLGYLKTRHLTDREEKALLRDVIDFINSAITRDTIEAYNIAKEDD